MSRIVRAFSPGSVGNVGVGFDILGHSIAGIGDVATVRRIDEPTVRIAAIRGTVTDLPLDAERNTAGMALIALREALALPFGFEVELDKGIPLGSGLGGSAASCVAALVAANEFRSDRWDRHEIAEMAFQAERLMLNIPGGWQDQYAAAFGGVNFIEFYAGERVVVNPLRVKNWILSELEASTVLYYSGVSRESARIIGEQQQRMARLDPDAIAALHALKDEAWTMKEHLLRGNIPAFAASMTKGWEAKKRTASNVSSALIDRAIDTALAHGAYSAKVSGAGGGGFVIFFVDPERRAEVVRALGSAGNGAVHPCHFTKYGTQGWRIG